MRSQIAFADGRKIAAEVDEVDWSPRRSATWSQIVDKFRTMAEPLIGKASTEEIVQLNERFEDLKDVREVTTRLGPTV